MTNGKAISKAQAQEFAFAFLSDIPNFIEAHKAEYISWLAENGLQDNTINFNDKEAENERKCG